MSEHFEKMLEILEPMNQERHLGILIETNGVIQKILTQRLKIHEEIKEIFNFFERIKKIEGIDLQQATIYVNGNYHVFTLINFLIKKNPKAIVFKKSIEEFEISKIGLSHIHTRAKERNIEVREV